MNEKDYDARSQRVLQLALRRALRSGTLVGVDDIAIALRVEQSEYNTRTTPAEAKGE